MFLWFLPPVVGTVIGYLTNVIAIKMLFRPLKAYYIFGLRIPFTPGILPKERSVLAKNIGNMVSSELLTAEIVRDRLLQDDVKEILLSLTDIVAGKIDEHYEEAVQKIKDFLSTPEMRRRIENSFVRFSQRIKNNLSTLQRAAIELGGYENKLYEHREQIVEDFIDHIEELLKKEEVRAKILALIKEDISGRSDQIIASVNHITPTLLAKFDVAALVENRINAMPMEKVEKIVLQVMADKFKWIDIFGGILGFLIGVIQVVFVRVLGM